MSQAELTLSSVCEAIVDCEHKTSPIDPDGEYFAVGTPAMRGNRINFAEARRISFTTFKEWTKRLTPRSGDLLLAREAPVGPVVLVPESLNVAPGQRTVLIRPRPGILDPRFLYYLLISPEQQARLLMKAEGSTVPHLNVADVRAFRLPLLPSLAEQKAIAATLGALDDKIESNRRVVSAALSLARAFVDRAAADHPKTTYSDAMEVLMGSAFKGNAFSAPGEGRALLRIRDLKTFEPQTWTTEARSDESIIRAGDIVVGMDAEFRATLWLGHDAVLNQRVCSFRGRGEVGRAFVLAALEPELAFQEQAKTGTTVIHLNKADIGTFTVPSLAPSEHKALAHATEPLIDIAVALSLENRQLARTRDALLPELLSGRIRVPAEESAA